MVIRGIKQTLPGVYKITPDAGSAFFLRAEYLTRVKEERLVCVNGSLSEEDSLFLPSENLLLGSAGVFDEGDTEDILHAALVYACESAAMTYLARAEQSRAGLAQKLLKKGLDKNAVSIALDFLEEAGYLSDERFAGAWLRSRSIDHAEGRRKLEAELSSRGIKKDSYEKALNEFFEDKSEKALCERAYRKITRSKKDIDEKKLYASLMRLGFPSKIIKSVLDENFDKSN